DPNFQKSVILLVEHSSEGAMGFIINRPSPIPIRELIAAQEVRIPDHAPTWVGGPVGTDNGLVLHNQPEDASASAVLSDMFSITSSTQALQGLADHARAYELAQGEAFTTEAGPFGPCLYPYRFLVGYAGWGPHQLEEELRLRTWL